MPVRVMLAQTLYDYMGQHKLLGTNVRGRVGACGMCEVQGVVRPPVKHTLFPGVPQACFLLCCTGQLRPCSE